MLSLLVLACYALPYVLRARTLRRAGRPVAPARVLCFAAGLVVIAVALSAPLDHLADRRFAAHMLEHLMLGDLAPLLIVLGCTGPLLAPVLRLRPVRALAPLAHPVPALLLWTASLYGWHLGPAYDLALRHEAVHVLQHGCFFVAGLALWTAVLGPLPKPRWFGVAAKMGYVTTAWLISNGLGAALVFARSPFYDRYTATDQSVGGAVMMVEQSVVVLVVLCWLFLTLFQQSGERQDLQELAAAGGIVLDPARAQRAVEAGRAAELAQRIGARP